MKKIILCIFVLCLIFSVKAQDQYVAPREQNPTAAIALVPQSFADNIAELNLDLRLSDRKWLTIAPLFQFGAESRYFNTAQDAIKNGIGLGLSYRYFPLTRRAREFSDGRGPFVSAGIRGLTTTYEYTGTGYVDFTDEYYNSGLLPSDKYYKDQVSQLGVDVNIGYVFKMFDILFLEGYMGVGSRFSNYTYNSSKGLDLGESSHDTGFTGYCMTGGLRLGIYLNRYTRR